MTKQDDITLSSDCLAEQRFSASSAILQLQDRIDNDPRRLLLIHGYLNSERAQADYRPHVEAARDAGWTGAIHGLRWDGGDPLAKIQAIAKRIVFLGIPIPGPHSVLIPARLGYFAYSIRRYWTDACTRADETGKALGEHLLRESEFDSESRWTIAAHSLGCRLTFEALTAMTGASGIVDDVFLCGGAVSAKADWTDAAASADGNVVNCFSRRDRVLRFFFQLANWQAPIGLGPIPSRCENLCNHDCSATVDNHFGYQNAFIDIFESVTIDDEPCNRATSDS